MNIPLWCLLAINLSLLLPAARAEVKSPSGPTPAKEKTHGHGSGLRPALTFLARKAGVDLVLDRAVDGMVPSGRDGRDARERLMAIARAAGYQVLEVHRSGGRDLIVISPTAAAPGADLAEAWDEEDPSPAGGPVHQSPRSLAGAAPPPGQESFLIDTMVVWMAPPLVEDLRAIGTQVAAGSDRTRPRFLDGIGPGIQILLFEPADGRLQGIVPWGVAGDCAEPRYRIRARDRFLVHGGESVQVPLERHWLHSSEEEEPGRAGLYKEALTVAPVLLSDGRVEIRLDMRRSFLSPTSMDQSTVKGGQPRANLAVAPGEEVLIWGFGLGATSALVPSHRPGGFSRRDLPRLGRGHDRGSDCREERLPMEKMVRLMVRVQR